jgi:hypothetical protein
MTKSACRKKSENLMTKMSWLSLVLLSVVGCGPRIPDAFTVSGQSLEHWFEALDDSEPQVRVRAVRALSNVGPDVPEIVDALADALADPEPEVRSQAALALLKFGPAAKAALPALMAAQSDADETVRELVGKAAEAIEGR